MTTTNIQSVHSEYETNLRNWKLVRDLIKGEQCIKQHDLHNINTVMYNTTSLSRAIANAFDLYLPFTSQSYTYENVQRYVTYVQRASLFNVTQRTKQGIVGTIFSNPSSIELPSDISYLETNADGSGIGLLDQAVEAIGDLLEVARLGLFVDYPSVSDEDEEYDELAMRANIIKYDAEQILDWDVINYGAAQKLSFVKLVEMHSERDYADPFKINTYLQYRVLMLIDGIYVQCVYDQDENEIERVIPLNVLGEPFQFIPFFFVGATDNRPDVDVAPLLELAELNIKHYINSADFEESVFLVGQPMVSFTGLDQTWKRDHPEGIVFGSREILDLPQGASVEVVQAEPNTMARQGMLDKEAQMIKLGARLLTEGGQAETATAALIRYSADVSILSVLVKNLTQAYNDAIMAVQLYEGSVDDFVFKINDDFFTNTLDAQKLTALVSSWQAGAITSDQLAQSLANMGIE